MSMLRNCALVALAAAIAGACTVKDEQATDAGAAGAGGGTAGAGGGPGGAAGDGGPGGGGTGGGGTGGTAGTEDAGPDPCEGIPTTGKCISDSEVKTCIVTVGDKSKTEVKTGKCDPDSKCVVENGSAVCKLQTECKEGDIACKTTDTLQECKSGKWTDNKCPSPQTCLVGPNTQAHCGIKPTSGPHLKGQLKYEYRVMKADKTGFDAPKAGEAGAVLVVVYEGNNALGVDYTKDDGTFDLTLTGPITDTSKIYYFPVMFGANGNPTLGVAQAKSSDPADGKSDAYWVWEGPDLKAGQTDTGTTTIPEKLFSGAMYLYEWMVYGMQRNGNLTGNAKAPTLLVFWNGLNPDQTLKEIHFDCGSCFLGLSFGGADVSYVPTQKDHYDTSICMSGTQDYPQHWSKSVVNHEFGHYTMQAFSLPPGEGGPHTVTGVYAPGLVYSEGWATYQGQSQFSDTANGEYDSLYFDVQGGTAFWIDIGKVEYSGGSPIKMPDPNGPIDQKMNENVVASILWHLWAPAKLGEGYQEVGEQNMFKALTSDRVKNPALNRGYIKTDLVDYLDGVLCTGAGTQAQVDGACKKFGFPYDAPNKKCN